MHGSLPCIYPPALLERNFRGAQLINQHPGDSAVRSFYDRYPYPRPVDDLDAYRRLWSDPARRCADFHLYWPDLPYREDFSILVAGCGTSQAAKHALRWPRAHVVGIDFSQTSVQHTQALKEKYALANLSVHQLSIERAHELNMTFDQIICTGVLHHLAEPAVGLDALSHLLTPGGAMQLMVYAPYGRAGIYMLQEFCRKLGLQANDEGVQLLSQILRVLPPGHPLENLIHNAPDFLNEAELADALLHPRDQAFTVAGLFTLLDGAGLEFARWVRQAAYLPRCSQLASTPLAHRLAQLPEREQYSAMELFRGSMLRHNVILYRKDASSPGREVSFRNSDWRSFVPIRIADTVCVQKRLPEGAVLINPAHIYPDLYLPISAIEKHWYDAIDGERSIDAVIENSPTVKRKHPDSEKARGFFERLWWYDQVVFDLSNT